VLGSLAMIDDGELDWKVIAIRSHDEMAIELEDISDLKRLYPQVISGIREWFRWYKLPDGKPLNQYGFHEEALPRKETLAVIEETHHYWKRLVEGKASQSASANLWYAGKGGSK
jgi:inorganic pyrophosphatase